MHPTEIYKEVASLTPDHKMQLMHKLAQELQMKPIIPMSFPTLSDGPRVTRMKLIKMLISMGDLTPREAKDIAEEFIADVRAQANEGFTYEQRKTRRADAMKIFTALAPNCPSNYEQVVEQTKRALKAFNEEF